MTYCCRWNCESICGLKLTSYLDDRYCLGVLVSLYAALLKSILLSGFCNFGVCKCHYTITVTKFITRSK